MQKHADNNASDQLNAYRLGEISRKAQKPAAQYHKEGNYSMPAAFFLDSFLKGCGVLFGFVQTPGYSGRK
jgi:hypothetical protein